MTLPGNDGADGDADDELALEDYYEQRLVGPPAVSPDGDRVAFVVTEFDGEDEESVASLFVAPTDGSRDPHRLTRVANASAPAFGPDGEQLAFLATRDTDVALEASRSNGDERDGENDSDGDDDSDVDDRTANGESDDDASEEDASDDGSSGGGAEDDGESSFGAEEKQVFVFDLARGGDARQVTTREYGVTEFDWGPDGERLVISAMDPTDEEAEYLEEREDDGPIEVERVQHKANGFGWTNEAKTYLFVVDVDAAATRSDGSDASTRLDDAYATGAGAALSGDRLGPQWGPDDRIAFGTYQREGADSTWARDLHTIAPDGSDHRVLTDGDVKVRAYAWHPDGDRIAYQTGIPGNAYVAPDVVVQTDASDSEERIVNTDECAKWKMDWVDDDTLFVAAGDDGQTVLHSVDVEAETTEQVYPAVEDDVNGVALQRQFDVADDGSVAALVQTTPRELDLHAFDVESALVDGPVPAVPRDGAGRGAADGDGTDATALTRLTNTNEAIAATADVAMERVRFESDVDVAVEGLAYYPASVDIDSDDADRRPVVVDIHGGPTVYDQPQYRFRYQYWVSRGYVVLNVNYRGSTSYGDEFAESIRGDWGRRESRDVVAGVEHLVDRGWVDPERVFVTGFSQGGINTAFVLAYSDVATAGAAEHGIYDFYSSYGTDDCHAWWDAEFGQPWEDPESYYELSSITKVDQIDDPLLLTAGENDWRCPPTQAEQMYVAVKKQGVDAKLVVYPDLPHDYGPPDTATHRLGTVTDWFREHDPAIDDESADEE